MVLKIFLFQIDIWGSFLHIVVGTPVLYRPFCRDLRLPKLQTNTWIGITSTFITMFKRAQI